MVAAREVEMVVAMGGATGEVMEVVTAVATVVAREEGKVVEMVEAMVAVMAVV